MVPRFQPPDILSNSYWAVRLPLASCTLINLQIFFTENVSILIHLQKICQRKLEYFKLSFKYFQAVAAFQKIQDRKDKMFIFRV